MYTAIILRKFDTDKHDRASHNALHQWGFNVVHPISDKIKVRKNAMYRLS